MAALAGLEDSSSQTVGQWEICAFKGSYMRLELQKLTILSQELKSKLNPKINDTFMHCPEASTTWQ